MFEQILSYGSLPLVVLGILAAGVGIPVPEDGMLLAAGVLSHRNAVDWRLVLGVVYTAVLVADTCVFFIGYHFGEPILARRPFRWFVTPERRARVTRLFERRGPFAVFTGRFVLGLRAAVFLTAGTERMRYRTFLFWDALAASITIPSVFALGYVFHSRIDVIREIVTSAQLGITVAIVSAVVVWAIVVRRRRFAGVDEAKPRV